MGQGRWWQPPGLSQQVRPQHLRPGRYCGMGHRLWRGQHPWSVRLRVRWYLLDRLRYVLPTGKPHWLLLQLLGLLRPAVPDLDGQREEPLSQDVAAMQNAGSLTGRKKAAVLAAGVKAQKALNQYSQCNVFWAPTDAQPLSAGGDGYVDG